jgi:hypothetical protein
MRSQNPHRRPQHRLHDDSTWIGDIVNGDSAGFTAQVTETSFKLKGIPQYYNELFSMGSIRDEFDIRRLVATSWERCFTLPPMRLWGSRIASSTRPRLAASKTRARSSHLGQQIVPV